MKGHALKKKFPVSVMGGNNILKFSGLANKKVLDVACQKTGKNEKIMMITKGKKGNLHKKGLAKASKKGLEVIKKAALALCNRRDLADLAVRKYQKVKDSFKKKKISPKSRRAGN